MAINICEHERWAVSDRALNETYQALYPNLAKPQQAQIIRAQQAWVRFRDAECELYSSYAEGGSMQPMLRSGCMANLTDDRTAELARYQAGQLPYGPYGTNRDQGNVERVSLHLYEALQVSISEHRQDKLLSSQVAWAEYRNAVCAFEHDFSDQPAGSIDCSVRLTEERIGQFVDYLQDYY
ncbi:MAG: DUF1311 domain-containing protein [Spirulina sp. SIO3F2]|nr:DUF1311 domain-containing protein [Spirulina sp. SIO3F2]